jgi:hypothetical protein
MKQKVQLTRNVQKNLKRSPYFKSTTYKNGINKIKSSSVVHLKMLNKFIRLNIFKMLNKFIKLNTF